MFTILAVLVLILLFLFLCYSADLIVINLKKIAKKLGIKVFFLGIILGIITSLPELAIGINSLINDIPDISFGHLMGGNIVLLGLILSISMILNRKIKTDKEYKPFLLALIYLFLPLVLAFNGKIGMFNGLVLILAYIALVFYLYKNNKNKKLIKINILDSDKTLKSLGLSFLGLLGMMVSSALIIKITIYILGDFNISPFIIGLVFYSIGTNLPELTIALRAYKGKSEELCFSNLLGAAMTHVLILGVFGFTRDIFIQVDLSYLFLIILSLIFYAVLYIFYRTDRLFSRHEGYTLLALYIVFVLGHILIQIF